MQQIILSPNVPRLSAHTAHCIATRGKNGNKYSLLPERGQRVVEMCSCGFWFVRGRTNWDELIYNQRRGSVTARKLRCRERKYVEALRSNVPERHVRREVISIIVPWLLTILCNGGPSFISHGIPLKTCEIFQGDFIGFGVKFCAEFSCHVGKHMEPPSMGLHG